MVSTYYKRLRKEEPWKLHYFWAKDRCRTRKTNSNYDFYAARGITFNLTMRQVKLLWLRDKAYSLTKPAIDRINSSIGYTLFNCRFIEQTENFLRAINKLK